jgi:hypothetical protein
MRCIEVTVLVTVVMVETSDPIDLFGNQGGSQVSGGFERLKRSPRVSLRIECHAMLMPLMTPYTRLGEVIRCR